MKKTSLYITALIYTSLIISSCAAKRGVTAGSERITDGKLWASFWHQRAAEYKALCFQAYNIAKLRLDESLKNNTSRQLALITDIDETVLDNSPNTVSQALKGKDYEPESWFQWTSKAACDTIPGAAAFLKYAASKGVSVFYITNREERERPATLENLKKYELPFADDAHLLLKQTSSGKEPRRLEVLKNNEVIMLIGDNLTDFSSLFDKQPEVKRSDITRLQSSEFGKRFIVLPNAVYGDWESSLYKYDYKLDAKQKEELILKVLRGE